MAPELKNKTEQNKILTGNKSKVRYLWLTGWFQADASY